MGFFDKIQETITSATEQTKAKTDEMQLKRERAKKLEALGEQVYGLYLGGQLTLAELEPACSEVADVDRRIAEAQAAAQAAAAPRQQQPGQEAAPGSPQAPQPPAPPQPPRIEAPPAPGPTPGTGGEPPAPPPPPPPPPGTG